MSDRLAAIYHNLSVMLDGGVPILRAVRSAGLNLKGRGPRAFMAVADAMRRGEDMADAMRRFPGVFQELDIMAVEVGDMSGELVKTLEVLSKWHYFLGRIRRLISTGMILPVVVFHVAVLVGWIPQLVLEVIDLNGYIGRVVGTFAVVYCTVILGFAVKRAMPSLGELRKPFDSMMLRVPVLGEAMHELSVSRYCRGFYLLFKAGVPISRCAERAIAVAGNLEVGGMFEGGARCAKKGRPVSEGLSGRLGADFVAAWRTGEETGELDNVVWKLAEDSGYRAEEIFKQIAKWVPIIVYWMVCAYIIYMGLKGVATIFSRGH